MSKPIFGKDLDLTRTVLDDLEAGEQALSLRQAIRHQLFLIDGKPHDNAWIYRLIQRGVRAKNGELVKLETAQIGGVLVTTDSAIRRLIARQNQKVAIKSIQRDAHAAAEARLAAVGL